MARVQLFLSTVTAEFLSYRTRLRHMLTRPEVEVTVELMRRWVERQHDQP